MTNNAMQTVNNRQAAGGPSVVSRKSSVISHIRGQSLVEILVAVPIGTLLILAAAALITPALKANLQASNAQAGAALAKELLDNINVWSEGNWHNIAGLATSSAYHYYLNTSSSPFSSSTGDESVVVSTTTYKRFFYVDDVYRDVNGAISGTYYDPSTKQITVGYSWPGTTTTTVSAYLSRSADRVFVQTDWSGGPNQSGPITSANSQFASSSANMNYSSTSGSIYLNL